MWLNLTMITYCGKGSHEYDFRYINVDGALIYILHEFSVDVSKSVWLYELFLSVQTRQRRERRAGQIHIYLHSVNLFLHVSLLTSC